MIQFSSCMTALIVLYARQFAFPSLDQVGWQPCQPTTHIFYSYQSLAPQLSGNDSSIAMFVHIHRLLRSSAAWLQPWADDGSGWGLALEQENGSLQTLWGQVEERSLSFVLARCLCHVWTVLFDDLQGICIMKRFVFFRFFGKSKAGRCQCPRLGWLGPRLVANEFCGSHGMEEEFELQNVKEKQCRCVQKDWRLENINIDSMMWLHFIKSQSIIYSM